MEHSNGDKVVITTDRDGHGIYFSVRDERDNGTIIDFIQNRQHLNLGEVRSQLRPWLQGRVSESITPIPKPQSIESERLEVLERFSKLAAVSSHPYLEQRGISSSTLADSRFEGTVYADERGNAIFPHYDQDGLTGFESRNHDFKGFSKGGKKSIWHSNFFEGDRRLVVVESPIDALSCHEYFDDPHTRYIATSGSVGERQLELMGSVFNKAINSGIEISIATDQDEAGEKLHEQLKEALPVGTTYYRLTPGEDFLDWNELLEAELEQQRQQKQQKERGRGFSL